MEDYGNRNFLPCCGGDASSGQKYAVIESIYTWKPASSRSILHDELTLSSKPIAKYTKAKTELLWPKPLKNRRSMLGIFSSKFLWTNK